MVYNLLFLTNRKGGGSYIAPKGNSISYSLCVLHVRLLPTCSKVVCEVGLKFSSRIFTEMKDKNSHLCAKIAPGIFAETHFSKAK